MSLSPSQLLDMRPIETRQELDASTVILYALGVGATELPFVYEEGLQALPTMAVTLAHPGFVWRDLNLGVDWRRVLHGETSVVLHEALPVTGQLLGYSTFGPIYDKGTGKGAVVYQKREIYRADGTHIATVRNGSFLRSEGGFGGTSDVQPKPFPLPDRAPDAAVTLPTGANQALIYRLSGDRNPLHIDPAVAQTAGFTRPILHGLASYGMAGRAILSTLLCNDPKRLKRLDVRFSSPAFPGDTLRIEIWRDAPGQAAFRALCAERNVVILNNGYAEFS